MVDTGTPIAGWYPDPENSAADRWWNGLSWSDYRRMSGERVTTAPADQVSTPAEPSPNSTTAHSVTPYGGTGTDINALALAGLVVSLSVLVLPIMGINGIVGMILGLIGLKEAKRRKLVGIPNTGGGLALSAIISGIAGTLLVWIGMALLIVYLYVIAEYTRSSGIA
jgi:hypothetical protein